MKTVLSALVFTSSIFAFGQQVHRCLSKEAIEFQNQLTPGFSDQVNQQFQLAKQWASGQIMKSDAEYVIPVVVHVVYNTANQNLADSVILDQLKVLNEDFGRLNADTVNLRTDFHPIAGNPKIHFRLATIDPSGNPTTGITRTQTATASFGSFAIFGGSFTDLEKVKSTANGGHDPWDQTRYLNIWVCNMSINILGQESTSLLGYATPPAGLPNWPAGSTPNLSDGVVIQYQCFGRNNPNPLDVGTGQPMVVRGRTVTHEVGHYLGLRHIWGDGDCTQEDGIDDTPNADDQSDFDCNITKNTCVDNILTYGDLPDMVENYMDYSSEECQNSFTKGQVDLIHGVLENQRYDLVHNNPASVSELTFSASVFPNPVTNQLLVKTDQPLNKVILMDAQGRKLNEFNHVHHQLQIDFAVFDSGLYLLLLEADNGSSQLKRINKM